MPTEDTSLGGQNEGDKLSRGTCPEGDNRDTPKGGVSRLSPVPSVGSVPPREAVRLSSASFDKQSKESSALTVIDSPTDHEGEPNQHWAWGSPSRKFEFDGDTFHRRGKGSSKLLTHQPHAPTLTPINRDSQ